MTQTTNRFFDEIGRLMNDAAERHWERLLALYRRNLI